MRRLAILFALSFAPLALASSEPAPETPPAAESREQPAAPAPRFMVSTSLVPYTILMANLEVEAVLSEHLGVYGGGYYSPLVGFGGQLGLRAYLWRALSGFYTDVYGSYFRYREITPGGGVGAGYTLALSSWRISAGAALDVSFPSPSITRVQPAWRLQVGFAF